LRGQCEGPHTYSCWYRCSVDTTGLKNLTNLDMSRSWRWQKCTELAYLQPGYAGSLRHEALSLDNLLDQCRHVFGADAIAPVRTTHTFFVRLGQSLPFCQVSHVARLGLGVGVG
jgi:hypothetical protein